jgi:multicopper oxidase
MSDLTRREFVRTAGTAGLALGLLPGLTRLVACAGGDASTARAGTYAARYADALRRARAAGQAVELRRVAAPGAVEVGPGQVYRTWLYDGAFPGPEIRVREGERLRVALQNCLPEPTTIHWHGVPLPNAMDGVPGVTQEPVAPSASFVYDFVAEPAGTYMYHSHVGHQLDRGLVGPLIIEERTPNVSYDRDYVLVLDDWLPSAPTPALARASGGMQTMRDMMRDMMGDRRGMMGQGMPLRDPARPEYAALLVNGKSPADPPAFEVRRGERVRLRFINLASATTFRVALAGHRLTVTHADGRPVEHVTVDAVVLGMGERYDAVVEADNPGIWTLAAASVLGDPPPAEAVIRYADARAARPAGGLPDGLTVGRLLDIADLVALEREGAPPAPDRSFDLTLSWGMMMTPDEWSIDGQRYPGAEPLPIRAGERVRVSMGNMSPIHHPMHLHGHFFRVGRARKDTVLVPAHMGRVTFEFTADNPGDWFFHCHNLYHMEAGMARVFRYG